jgi:thiosulfate dehydrogenase [quinone] large subunit
LFHFRREPSLEGIIRGTVLRSTISASPPSATLAAVRVAAVVRILTGLLFTAEGLSKLTGDFVRGGFAKQVGRIAAGSFPFWKRFLEAAVVPHADAFGWVVALGELAVGIGLLAGFLTRIASAGGALLMLSIALGEAKPEAGAAWDDWITSGLTPKLALLLLVLLCAINPGKVWGLDGRRGRRPGRLKGAD